MIVYTHMETKGQPDGISYFLPPLSGYRDCGGQFLGLQMKASVL